MSFLYRICILAVIGFSLTACEVGRERMDLVPINFESLDGWEFDDHHEALAAFKRSCDVFEKYPESKVISSAAGKAGEWQRICWAARKTDPDEAQRFFESYFIPYKVTFKGDSTGLFTGYYESTLKGSRTRHGRYQYPIYRMPRGLSPKPSRKQIEMGALKGRGLEICYVNDPVALFSMHIQGSARVVLNNGEIIRTVYAGQNGHKYVAIGRTLEKKGYMDGPSINAESIKQWLRANPDKAREIMWANPSFIFHREVNIPGADGPIGAQGIPISPLRTLAVDRRFIPYGVPLWLETTYPESPATRPGFMRRLMIAQDTGGSIKGAVRGDVFFGHGKGAEVASGFMRQQGSYYMLLPR
jgi:membrane-bound lytic murein transglycosylase A